MKYLLDTNIWSYMQARRASVIERIGSLPTGSVLYISVVSQGEMLAGIEILAQGNRKMELRRFYDDVVERVATIIDIDQRVAERWAQVFADLRRAGTPIVTNDIWIGATALVHDLVLVTNDAHFAHIRGLRTEDWLSPRAF